MSLTTNEQVLFDTLKQMKSEGSLDANQQIMLEKLEEKSKETETTNCGEQEIPQGKALFTLQGTFFNPHELINDYIDSLGLLGKNQEDLEDMSDFFKISKYAAEVFTVTNNNLFNAVDAMLKKAKETNNTLMVTVIEKIKKDFLTDGFTVTTGKEFRDYTNSLLELLPEAEKTEEEHIEEFAKNPKVIASLLNENYNMLSSGINLALAYGNNPIVFTAIMPVLKVTALLGALDIMQHNEGVKLTKQTFEVLAANCHIPINELSQIFVKLKMNDSLELVSQVKTDTLDWADPLLKLLRELAK